MARPSAKTQNQPSISREAKGQPLTSERIAADLAAFRKSGGRIEVLVSPFRAARNEDAKPE